jgi:hypothetical protein
MADAGDLRRRAEHALRIARSILDEQAAQAIRELAARLFEEAEGLEQNTPPPPPASVEEQPPAQQQQQIQPKDEDKKE